MMTTTKPEDDDSALEDRREEKRFDHSPNRACVKLAEINEGKSLKKERLHVAVDHIISPLLPARCCYHLFSMCVCVFFFSLEVQCTELARPGPLKSLNNSLGPTSRLLTTTPPSPLLHYILDHIIISVQQCVPCCFLSEINLIKAQ